MADQKPSDSRRLYGRAEIIRVVQTPLAFFVLVVLVIEGILGVLALKFPSPERSYVVLGMLTLIALLVVLVATLAVWRPGALVGTVPEPRGSKPTAKRFRKGDRVRIGPTIDRTRVITSDGVVIWDRTMDNYRGRLATVVSIGESPLSYSLDIDNGQFRWASEWLELEK